jgi:hypothetical protein
MALAAALAVVLSVVLSVAALGKAIFPHPTHILVSNPVLLISSPSSYPLSHPLRLHIETFTYDLKTAQNLINNRFVSSSSQLFHYRVIEAFTGTLKRNKDLEDLPSYKVGFESSFVMCYFLTIFFYAR